MSSWVRRLSDGTVVMAGDSGVFDDEILERLGGGSSQPNEDDSDSDATETLEDAGEMTNHMQELGDSCDIGGCGGGGEDESMEESQDMVVAGNGPVKILSYEEALCAVGLGQWRDVGRRLTASEDEELGAGSDNGVIAGWRLGELDICGQQQQKSQLDLRFQAWMDDERNTSNICEVTAQVQKLEPFLISTTTKIDECLPPSELDNVVTVTTSLSCSSAASSQHGLPVAVSSTFAQVTATAADHSPSVGGTSTIFTGDDFDDITVTFVNSELEQATAATQKPPPQKRRRRGAGRKSGIDSQPPSTRQSYNSVAVVSAVEDLPTSMSSSAVAGGGGVTPVSSSSGGSCSVNESKKKVMRNLTRMVQEHRYSSILLRPILENTGLYKHELLSLQQIGQAVHDGRYHDYEHFIHQLRLFFLQMKIYYSYHPDTLVKLAIIYSELDKQISIICPSLYESLPLCQLLHRRESRYKGNYA